MASIMEKWHISLKNGFYTALGTPLNERGEIVTNSLVKHIEQQITAEASGLLLMGSMGIQSAIRNSEYPKAAKVAQEIVKGRVPLFVGVMDNSIMRVKDRIDSLNGLSIDGVVATTPFYSKCTDEEIISFFQGIASISPFPVYLYDLPVVTKLKITFEIVNEVSKCPNIVGIKTGDIILARRLKVDMPDFQVLFSTIDAFDVAKAYGIRKLLDGMFSCTPRNAQKMSKCFEQGDFIGGSKYLNNILDLRDTMARYGIMPCFTAAMNLLGCEGNFAQDYSDKTTEPIFEIIKSKMMEIGEL